MGSAIKEARKRKLIEQTQKAELKASELEQDAKLKKDLRLKLERQAKARNETRKLKATKKKILVDKFAQFKSNLPSKPGGTLGGSIFIDDKKSKPPKSIF